MPLLQGRHSLGPPALTRIVRQPGVPGQLRGNNFSLKPAYICSSITSSRSLKPWPFPLPQRRKYWHCHPPPLNSPGIPTSAAQRHGLLPAVKTQKRVSITFTMSQQPPAPCSPKAPQVAKDMLAGLLGAPDTNSCLASLGQRLKSWRETPRATPPSFSPLQVSYLVFPANGLAGVQNNTLAVPRVTPHLHKAMRPRFGAVCIDSLE